MISFFDLLIRKRKIFFKFFWLLFLIIKIKSDLFFNFSHLTSKGIIQEKGEKKTTFCLNFINLIY